jgi:hypothetical protein
LSLVTRKFRIPEHSAQITNTKAASFPSDPQLPLNPFENMDKVRVTILLAVFTPRHRCAGSFQPSGKHIHFLQWHTHLDLAQQRSVVQPPLGPPCSHPWQSGPLEPLIHHANQSSSKHLRRWLTLSLATLTPQRTLSTTTIACLDRTAVQSPETLIIGFQANVRQR